MDFQPYFTNLYVQKGKIRKGDVDSHPDLPSYNTCLRKGLSLLKLNRQLAEASYRKNCKHCETPLVKTSWEKSFCSQSCSAKYNNKQRKTVQFCETCKIELRNKASRFCSSACHQTYRLKEQVKSWETNSNTLSARVAKQLLIDSVGYFCSVCGISEWNNQPITLELEHKNGDSGDNRKSNLCLLCPNCHSQTPTFRAKNKGKGRHSRRLRYQAGLSY